MGVEQSVGGGAVNLCGQGGLGLCPRLGSHGLAPSTRSPGMRTLMFAVCRSLINAVTLLHTGQTLHVTKLKLYIPR